MWSIKRYGYMKSRAACKSDGWARRRIYIYIGSAHAAISLAATGYSFACRRTYICRKDYKPAKCCVCDEILRSSDRSIRLSTCWQSKQQWLILNDALSHTHTRALCILHTTIEWPGTLIHKSIIVCATLAWSAFRYFRSFPSVCGRWVCWSDGGDRVPFHMITGVSVIEITHTDYYIIIIYVFWCKAFRREKRNSQSGCDLCRLNDHIMWRHGGMQPIQLSQSELA